MSLTNSEQTIKYHLLLPEVNVPYLNLCIPSFDRYPQLRVSFGFLRKKHDPRNSDTYFVVILRAAASAAVVVPLVLVTVLVLVVFIGACKKHDCGFVWSEFIKLQGKTGISSRYDRSPLIPVSARYKAWV